MKIVISESQYKRLIETEEEEKVLHIPSMKFFNDDWDLLQKFLKLKGNPPYSIGGDLYLEGTRIESLGNLQSVGGSLYLGNTPISKKYSEEEIRQIVNVGGKIYL